MPRSIDPEPAENEIECARCGAHVYYELTRCPNCGINLYEPEDDLEEALPGSSEPNRMMTGLRDTLHRLFKKPYAAEEIFGDGLNQASLYNDLLRKVGGDHLAADRLIEFERRRAPDSTRILWIKRAIQRWEKDNRAFDARSG